SSTSGWTNSPNGSGTSQAGWRWLARWWCRLGGWCWRHGWGDEGATRRGVAARNAAVNAVVDLVDGGTGAGYVEIRTGTQPATVDDPATGTLLVTIELAPQAFSSAVGGTATLESVPRGGTAEGTGTAGWFRVYDGDGSPLF